MSETTITCGHPWASRSVGGCGTPLDVRTVYRCLDCHTAYCQGCLAEHFGGTKRTDAQRIRKLEDEVRFYQYREEARRGQP